VVVHVPRRDPAPARTVPLPGAGLPGQQGVTNAPDHSVGANARILEGFIDALDLQDVTMVVHDAGGPAGFLVATRRPERFRALVISNTFGWPLAAYPAVRRTLRVVASRPFGAVNRLTNVTARFTASRYGVGRRMSKADRRSFLGPWRSRGCRRATWQVLAGPGPGADPESGGRGHHDDAEDHRVAGGEVRRRGMTPGRPGAAQLTRDAG
jgi:pimeloyl-ACP methyl ester carboxylesterase